MEPRTDVTDPPVPAVFVTRVVLSLVMGGMLATVILAPTPGAWIVGTVLVVAVVVLGIRHDRMTRPAARPPGRDPRGTGWVLLLVALSCVAPLLRDGAADSWWGVPAAVAGALCGATVTWRGLSRPAPGNGPDGRTPRAASAPPSR